MNLTLQRITFDDQHPTFGVLLNGYRPVCVTIERPWAGNQAEVSCIPPGTYPCIPHDSPAHPHTWELTGVPGRSDILLHTGNTMSDSKGCIIVGQSFTENSVLTSILTMEKLRNILPQNFTLTIVNPTGENT